MSTKLNNPQLVLIDLDGTLVDSVPDLAQAVDAMMAELGMPARGAEQVRHWVGNGVERLIKRALTGELHAEPQAGVYERAYPLFYQAYQAANGRYSRLFPGVEDGLAYLQSAGIAIGCVTNKAADFTLPLLEALGIRKYFGVVVSGDTLPQKKPAPEPLLYAANHFAIRPEHAVMIGDSMHDVEAARAAGFQVVCVSYGYNHGIDIREARPDAVIDSFVELRQLFSKAA